MKTRTILALVALIILFASCTRYITPYEAANGKAKCGRGVK
jgi:PBP1b-binding outer membrane lipoprotein LpoB